jgi:hypothetical protein
MEAMLRPGADLSWWPALDVQMPFRRLVVGERLVVAVGSPLLYRLRMLVTITSLEAGTSLAVSSDGDLSGRGRIDVQPDGATASVLTIHWDVSTRKAWMNATAWLLRPVFVWAHQHVMRRGEEQLRRVLAT